MAGYKGRCATPFTLFCTSPREFLHLSSHRFAPPFTSFCTSLHFVLHLPSLRFAPPPGSFCTFLHHRHRFAHPPGVGNPPQLASAVTSYSMCIFYLTLYCTYSTYTFFYLTSHRAVTSYSTSSTNFFIWWCRHTVLYVQYVYFLSVHPFTYILF